MTGFFERLVAGRWIAGTSIEDALVDAKTFNRYGVAAIINYLGEDYHSRIVVEDAVQTYLALIREIGKRKLKADISAKITELGVLIDKKLVLDNYSKIVDYAAENRVFVWLDMEEHRFVNDTIRLYESKVAMGNTGICIQSYLRRSLGDLGRLPASATIRLVKGAYSESAKIAFPTRKETTENYLVLMEYLFRRFKRFTIATHDANMLQKAIGLNKKYKRDVTYAVLKGIRNDYAMGLAKKGEKVSIYVPFGKEWILYSYRRMRELGNLRLFLRSLLGG